MCWSIFLQFDRNLSRLRLRERAREFPQAGASAWTDPRDSAAAVSGGRDGGEGASGPGHGRCALRPPPRGPQYRKRPAPPQAARRTQRARRVRNPARCERRVPPTDEGERQSGSRSFAGNSAASPVIRLASQIRARALCEAESELRSPRSSCCMAPAMSHGRLTCTSGMSPRRRARAEYLRKSITTRCRARVAPSRLVLRHRMRRRGSRSFSDSAPARSLVDAPGLSNQVGCDVPCARQGATMTRERWR